MGSALTSQSMQSVDGINYEATVNQFNGIADINWGEGGIHVYLGRCLFRRYGQNLYHWGIIVGSYEDNFLGPELLQENEFMSINWSSVGLKVEMGLTFQEAKEKCLLYSSQLEDPAFYIEERENLKQA